MPYLPMYPSFNHLLLLSLLLASQVLASSSSSQSSFLHKALSLELRDINKVSSQLLLSSALKHLSFPENASSQSIGQSFQSVKELREAILELFRKSCFQANEEQVDSLSKKTLLERLCKVMVQEDIGANGFQDYKTALRVVLNQFEFILKIGTFLKSDYAEAMALHFLPTFVNKIRDAVGICSDDSTSTGCSVTAPSGQEGNKEFKRVQHLLQTKYKVSTGSVKGSASPSNENSSKTEQNQAQSQQEDLSSQFSPDFLTKINTIFSKSFNPDGLFYSPNLKREIISLGKSARHCLLALETQVTKHKVHNQDHHDSQILHSYLLSFEQCAEVLLFFRAASSQVESGSYQLDSVKQRCEAGGNFQCSVLRNAGYFRKCTAQDERPLFLSMSTYVCVSDKGKGRGTYEEVQISQEQLNKLDVMTDVFYYDTSDEVVRQKNLAGKDKEGVSEKDIEKLRDIGKRLLRR